MAKKGTKKKSAKVTRGKSKTIARGEMIKRYGRLYSGPIYDVLEPLGLPNQVLSHEIKPLQRGYKLTGPALTQQGVDTVPGVVPEPKNHFDNMRKACTRGCVAVYAMGREGLSGHWGELTSTIAMANGCQGAVIDGGARDSDLQEKMGFKMYCRFTSPIEAGSRMTIMQLQKPIFMPGSLTTHVRVNPGDWVFADGDGVTIIPKAIAGEVLVKAEELVDREAKGREMFAAGVDPTKVVKMFDVG